MAWDEIWVLVLDEITTDPIGWACTSKSALGGHGRPVLPGENIGLVGQ